MPDLPRHRRPARALALCLLAAVAILACTSPTLPASPTPVGSGVATQRPGPSASLPAATGATSRPGPSASHTTGGSPTPFQSRIGPDPCRLLTADEVNGALGGGFQLGGGQGQACVFPGNGTGTSASLVSVAAVDGDVITPVRSRYPDIKDVTVVGAKAEWSPSVGTLWLVIDGPKTVMVSILGTTLADEALQSIALQLAQLAATRI